MQDRKKDTDVYKGLLDSEGEGKGGMIWENGIETMNYLDHWINLVSNREASPAMGPSSQGCWRFIGNHRLCRDRGIKRDSFLKGTEELRQVYNLQYMQVTECKVLLNCKFPMAITKGNGTQACIKYD